MQKQTESKKKIWTGRVLSGLVIAFLLFDCAIKLMRIPMAIQGTIELGYPAGVLVPLGVVLLLSTLLYAIPRTAVLGAVLLTGYLGGAVATHVRVGNPWASHILFPIYLGVMLWGGLYLRDRRLKGILS